MTSTDTKYNGWTNYETWAVKLWIDNEESTYNYWTHQTGAVWRNAEHDHPNYFTRSEYARFTLADELKDSLEETSESVLQEMPSTSLWSQLLSAALSEVNWPEIADNMLSDTDGYERAE